MTTDKNLLKLATVLTHLAAHYLDHGERITLDRYGRSITWDATAKLLPTRVRGGAETTEERAEFSERVLSTDAQALLRPDLAGGLKALRPGLRLSVVRLASAPHNISLEIVATQPGGTGHGRAGIHAPELCPDAILTAIKVVLDKAAAGR